MKGWVEPRHVTHPSTNRARRRVTSLIRPLRHAANRCIWLDVCGCCVCWWSGREIPWWWWWRWRRIYVDGRRSQPPSCREGGLQTTITVTERIEQWQLIIAAVRCHCEIHCFTLTLSSNRISVVLLIPNKISKDLAKILTFRGCKHVVTVLCVTECTGDM